MSLVRSVSITILFMLVESIHVVVVLFELIYSDGWSPYHFSSFKGFRFFFLVFVDDILYEWT